MTDLPYLSPLDRPALAALDIPEPWSYGIADRVRFYELDALNHVNNVAYFRWFETLRIAYFRDYGLSTYSEGDPQLVVISNAARYFAPTYLNESYVVTGRTAVYRNSAFRMEYGIFAEGNLRCSGEAVIVSLEQDGRTKRPLPDAIRAVFRDRDSAMPEG